MKLVVAVIQPIKLHAVCEALEKVEVMRMTICDAQGFERPEEPLWTDQGHQGTRVLRKIVLEIVVNDDFLKRTVETIAGVARTGPEGTAGDGKIFIVPTEEAVQVDDAARGPGAV